MANEPDSKLTVLTKQNCRAILSQDGVVFVQCWSTACGACVADGSVYTAVAGKHPQHTFAKLDAQGQRELTSQLEIVHVPTLLLYRDGILLFKQAGSFDEARLEDIIAQVEGLNMDDVRAEMERERCSAEAEESTQ